MRTFNAGEDDLSPQDLDDIADIVSDGGVIVYPTETVYGIGCDPHNKKAVERVFELKFRKPGGDVSVAFGSIEEANRWVTLSPLALKILNKYAPGPLTVLVPRPPEMDIALPWGDLFGIRIPSHPVARKLLSASGPLISTSANRHGQLPTQEEARRLGDKCDALILADGVDGMASTVVSLSSAGAIEVLRKGAIDIDI